MNSIGVLVFVVLCIISYAAFGVFYAREEGTTAAKVKAIIGVVVASIITFFFGIIGGGIAIAATFYVVDRKNRSRGWAPLAFLLGPIALLIAVSLPKLEDTSSLSLLNPPEQSPSDRSASASQGR
jgi:peptidoglycan biosynthesis protein MviN/MurJ (putative lipid II flippase)